MRQRNSKGKVRPFEENIYHCVHNDKNINLNTIRNSATDYVPRSEIKKKAIQVFYTESEDTISTIKSSKCCTWRNIVLHPNGSVRRIFDLVTVVWVLTLVFFIPFLIGFDWYLEPTGLTIFLDLLDVWFAIDILLNFRTGYIHHGTAIMTPDKIVRNYLTRWFIVDLLGTFPFEKLIQGKSHSRKSLKLIKYFKIPKLLRISRLMKYVHDHKQVYDIFQVFVLVMTILHFGACVLMIILNPCSDLGDGTGTLGDMKICSQDNIFNLYSESFHLSAVMILGVSNIHILGGSATVDMMTRRREIDQMKIYIVSTVYMIGGLCLVALLISELNVFLFGKKQGSAAFQRKIDRVTYEMEYYGVPDDIQRQVRAFYDYIWIHQRQYDDKVALLSDDQMSTDLQRKLALHLFKDVVSQISLFSEIDDLLLGEICLSLRTRIFLPHDMIIFKGDVGKELFIIAKGVVEVLRDDLPSSQRKNVPPIFLRSGSCFGEIALIMETRRTCSVQAKTMCETNILQQHTFDSILQHNPHFARRVNELVVARQLERSFSKQIEEPTDLEVQVSQVDMAKAISVVEKNMKEGLERRLQKKQSWLGDSGGELDKSCDSSTDRLKVSLNQTIGSSTGLPDQQINNESVSAKREESKRFGPGGISSTAISPRSNLNDKDHDDDLNHEVDKVIDDIARRSTRHPRSSLQLPDKIINNNRNRVNTSDSSDVEIGYSQSRSQLIGKSYNSSRSPKTKVSQAFPENHTYTHDDSIVFIEDGNEEDAETMLVTGHFNPKTVTVDIKKVNPTILNCGKRDSSSALQTNLSKINERLDLQEQMMKSILSKISQLSTIKKSQSRSNNNDDKVLQKNNDKNNNGNKNPK